MRYTAVASLARSSRPSTHLLEHLEPGDHPRAPNDTDYGRQHTQDSEKQGKPSHAAVSLALGEVTGIVAQPCDAPAVASWDIVDVPQLFIIVT